MLIEKIKTNEKRSTTDETMVRQDKGETQNENKYDFSKVDNRTKSGLTVLKIDQQGLYGNGSSFADSTMKVPWSATPINFTSWTPTVSYAGGTTNPTTVNITQAIYKILGDQCFYQIKASITRGSGNRTFIQFSLPVDFDSEQTVAQVAIENIVQAGVVPRAAWLETISSIDKVTVGLGSAMSQASGIISVSGNYRI